MSFPEQPFGTRLTLDLWHPNCWAIEATEQTGGGVLAHAIYNTPQTDGSISPQTDESIPAQTDGGTLSQADRGTSSVNGLFTAFADTEAEVERLLDAISASDYAGELLELQERFGRARNAPGNVVREFFLEYDPDDMICPTLLEHGLVHSAPVRIENGREKWEVCFAGERSEIEDSLDGVREQAGADVSVDSITASETDGLSARDQRLDTLTTAQRRVFEHARETGYYDWPRGTSTRELADDLDISKTTLLEHLRKAESKLLNP